MIEKSEYTIEDDKKTKYLLKVFILQDSEELVLNAVTSEERVALKEEFESSFTFGILKMMNQVFYAAEESGKKGTHASILKCKIFLDDLLKAKNYEATLSPNDDLLILTLELPDMFLNLVGSDSKKVKFQLKKIEKEKHQKIKENSNVYQYLYQQLKDIETQINNNSSQYEENKEKKIKFEEKLQSLKKENEDLVKENEALINNMNIDVNGDMYKKFKAALELYIKIKKKN